MNTLCLAEQEPDNVGREILATGEEPLKVRVISRHSFRLISLLKILVGLTKTQAKGKHNSAVRARHSSNRQTPIWPFGVYVSLAFFPRLVEEQSTLITHLNVSAVVVVVNSFAKEDFL